MFSSVCYTFNHPFYQGGGSHAGKNDPNADGAKRKAVGRVDALGLVSGMFYTTKLDQIGLFLPPMLYGKDWRRHPFRPYMNPEHPEIVSHLPPAMLLTARGDFLRRYSQQYAKALQNSGADCRLIDLDGERELPHAFAALLPEAPESRQVTKDMISFFLAQ